MRYFVSNLRIEHMELLLEVVHPMQAEKEPTPKEVVESYFPYSEIEYDSFLKCFDVDNGIYVTCDKHGITEVTEEEFNILNKFK